MFSKSTTIAILEGLRFKLEKQISKSENALAEVEALEEVLEILINTDK